MLLGSVAHTSLMILTATFLPVSESTASFTLWKKKA